MLRVGRSRIKVITPGGNVNDGKGGWVQGPDTFVSDRGTLRSPSRTEVEQAARENVKLDMVVDVRMGLPVKKGDTIEVSGNLSAFMVESVPGEGIPGRATKAVFVRAYEKGGN